MDTHEHELVRRLYDLHLRLYDHQTQEIAALRRATHELEASFASLQESRDVIHDMLKIVGELVRPS